MSETSATAGKDAVKPVPMLLLVIAALALGQGIWWIFFVPGRSAAAAFALAFALIAGSGALWSMRRSG